MIENLTDSDGDLIKAYLSGGKSLPNDLKRGEDTIHTTVRRLSREAADVLKDSFKPGTFSRFGKRRACLLAALSRDMDSAAAGDRTLRRHGFDGRLRIGYELERGRADNEGT